MWFIPVIPVTWEVEVGGSLSWQKLEIIAEKETQQKDWGHASSGKVLV
jgi:hypothetical protein